MSEQALLRTWLRENGYADIADLADDVRAGWLKAGKRTRRNWWEILAGDGKGRPRKVAGREFPILMAAQVRQGMPVTPNAICRRTEEKPPPVRVTGRWPVKPSKKRAKPK